MAFINDPANSARVLMGQRSDFSHIQYIAEF